MKENHEMDDVEVTVAGLAEQGKKSYSAVKMTLEGAKWGALVPLGIFIILVIIGKLF